MSCCGSIDQSTVQGGASYSAQIILLDAANSIHATDVGTETDKLDTDLCALLNDLVLVVGPLPWSGVRIKLNIR